MLDKERIVAKVDEFDGYLNELRQVLPIDFEEYKRIEKKRSCERLLQLCVECLIDISSLFVSGLRLGLPTEENDLFNKMRKANLISEDAAILLKQMRGLRNILIHEYADIDDKAVHNALINDLDDFNKIRKELMKALNKPER